jgi:hypothetical protein
MVRMNRTSASLTSSCDGERGEPDWRGIALL